MIFDKSIEFDWRRSLTAGTSYSTNVVDLQETGQGVTLGVVPHDIGTGLSVALEACAAFTFASGVVTVRSIAAFTAADVGRILELPCPPIPHRYLRLKYTTTSTAQISAAAVDDVQTWAMYPDNR